MHAITYDPIHDEFSVPQQFGQAVLTFRGGANGEEPPLRVIQGSLTQLQNPDRLDVDPVHNEIFVPQDDVVLVFPREAVGNVAPIRVLKGTQMPVGRVAVAVDPVHDLLVVGGSQSGVGGRLLIYNRTDQGSTKPRAVIGGPRSGLGTVQGPFGVYPPRNEIILGSRIGRRGEISEMASENFYVGVWSTQDNGDIPPRFLIGGPHGVLRQVRGVALDPTHKSIIVSDKRLNAVMTFYVPEIF